MPVPESLDYALLYSLHEAFAPRMRKAFTRAVQNNREINRTVLEEIVSDLFRATVKLLSYKNEELRSDFLIDDDVTRLVAAYVNIIQPAVVRDTVSRMFPAGLSAPERASRLRAVRYLDEQSAVQVENRRQQLREQEDSDVRVERQIQRFRDELVQRRGNLIATTETSRVINAAVQSLAMHNMNHDPVVEWVARLDNRVERECVHLDGERVQVGDSFVTLSGKPVQHPPAHPACRCFLVVIWNG